MGQVRWFIEAECSKTVVLETSIGFRSYAQEKHLMAFTWNPFSQFEFDEGNVVIRLPHSGYFARVSGPIVELLSQLPFGNVEDAVRVWQDRTGVPDNALRKAKEVWQQLCDGEIILSSSLGQGEEGRPSNWITLSPNDGLSHFFRFVDFQDFSLEEEDQDSFAEEAYDDEVWRSGI